MMAMTGSSLIFLAVLITVIAAMSLAEWYMIRRLGVWGIVIPIVSCFLTFLNFLFLIGAAIQFVIFIVMFKKQKKQRQIDKMNIQDL